jgi:UDP-3-O-[3-hydroxymyristoyl] glucosamine N-acyltransferase
MATMKSRVVLGAGDMLDLVACAWSDASPGEAIIRVEATQRSDYSFDLRALDAFDPVTTLLFAAFDERFGNFKRAELMQAAMARGFHLATIVARGAEVASTARTGRNVFIAPGAVVGSGVSIDYNSVLHAGSVVCHGARIKASCWIESGVTIGAHADVAAHVTLRTGVLVAPSVKIGRYCDIGVPGLYRTHVASKTIIDPRYDTPILVYGE